MTLSRSRPETRRHRRFEWDAAKAHANLWKHGVSFEVACQAFNDPLVSQHEDVFATGEVRWITMGTTSKLTLLVVIHATWYDGDQEVVRIISARKAERRERRIYEEENA